jgi:carboxymethylenebutenolidase
LGRWINLIAADGHRFDAWEERPGGVPRGAIVLVQEIFGVTDQLRRCAARYAEGGWVVVVPALFDRREPGLTLAYDQVQRAGSLAFGLPEDQVITDLDAARSHAAGEAALPVAVVGFCWGGTLAYVAAARLPVRCAVSFYGGGVAKASERLKPAVPLQYHFGALDRFIPPAAIAQAQAADPAGEFHVYEGADHGFCCDDRSSYSAEATVLAETRAQAFLARQLAG